MNDFLSNLVTRSVNGSDAVRPQLGTIYDSTLENRAGFVATEERRESTSPMQRPNEWTERLSRVESIWQRVSEPAAEVRSVPAPIAFASPQAPVQSPPEREQVASEQHAKPNPSIRDASDSSQTKAPNEPPPRAASPEIRAQKVIELIQRESRPERGPRTQPKFRAFPQALPPFRSLAQRAKEREDLPEPAINVTIGRVEIRANLPQPTASENPRTAAPIKSLDEYLRERAGGNRR